MTRGRRADRAWCRLDRPELAPLVDELARRLSKGEEPSVLMLRALPDSSRRAIADLFGLDRLPAGIVRVRVGRLTDVLGLAPPVDLRAGVESLRGPLPDRRAERTAVRSAQDDLWAWLADEAATLALGTEQGWAGTWVERVRSQGARGGVPAHRRRLEDVLRVLLALPADGVPLPAFADDLLGDPHALDRGRSRPALVLDAVALATGSPFPSAAAEVTRRLWESVGVAPDPLSSTVLVLGLPGDDLSPVGRWLAEAQVSGEAVVLTLAQLRRWPVAAAGAEQVVYVVENPSLIAEAVRRRWSGAPLVCTSGRPTVAVLTLLRQLAAGGGRLLQHADFDPAGLSITAWLAEHAGTTPWRMTAAHYVAALSTRQRAPSPLPAVPETPWDPALRDVLQEAGCPIYEEELRVDLLAAMGRAADEPSPGRPIPG